MTYAQYGNIQAVDYNTLVGSTTSSTANAFNTTWATGSGSAGYGQAALAQVGTGDTVDDATWANLINLTANAALHQGSSITSISAPAAGDTIAYLNALPTNLQTIYSNRSNASLQGSTSSNSVATTQSWTDKVVWAHTITFTGTNTAYGTINGGDAARYFFNAGGQIKMTCSHPPTGTAIDILLNSLASNVGTLVVSSPSSGSVTIAGPSYTGIKKVNGGGNTPNPYLTNNGYFALSTSNASVFTQTAGGSLPSYTGTFINYTIKSNGPQGSNSDRGSVITIYTTWDEVSSQTGGPGYLQVSAGSNVTCTLQFPETTYIANSWGTVSVSGVIQSIV